MIATIGNHHHGALRDVERLKGAGLREATLRRLRIEAVAHPAGGPLDIVIVPRRGLRPDASPGRVVPGDHRRSVIDCKLAITAATKEPCRSHCPFPIEYREERRSYYHHDVNIDVSCACLKGTAYMA